MTISIPPKRGTRSTPAPRAASATTATAHTNTHTHTRGGFAQAHLFPPPYSVGVQGVGGGEGGLIARNDILDIFGDIGIGDGCFGVNGHAPPLLTGSAQSAGVWNALFREGLVSRVRMPVAAQLQSDDATERGGVTGQREGGMNAAGAGVFGGNIGEGVGGGGEIGGLGSLTVKLPIGKGGGRGGKTNLRARVGGSAQRKPPSSVLVTPTPTNSLPPSPPYPLSLVSPMHKISRTSTT